MCVSEITILVLGGIVLQQHVVLMAGTQITGLCCCCRHLEIRYFTEADAIKYVNDMKGLKLASGKYLTAKILGQCGPWGEYNSV